MESYEHQIDDLVLIPSRGGVFEVVVNGSLVYSKKETGRHAEHDEILKEIRAQLSV